MHIHLFGWKHFQCRMTYCAAHLNDCTLHFQNAPIDLRISMRSSRRLEAQAAAMRILAGLAVSRVLTRKDSRQRPTTGKLGLIPKCFSSAPFLLSLASFQGLFMVIRKLNRYKSKIFKVPLNKHK